MRTHPTSGRRTLALAAVLLLSSAAALLAHDTWLLPAALRVPAGRPVRLSLTSGVAFPADDFAILPSRIVRADVRLAGGRSALSAPRSSARATLYEWTPATEGVATIAVALAPKVLTLAPDKIEEYLTEIDAGPAVRAAWAAIPAPKRWRESYSKHAKTFVRVGNPPSRDSSWARPMDLGLEFVPQRDPTTLQVGDTLPLLVLRHGVPATQFSVGALRAGEQQAKFYQTDGNGVARVVVPREGLWLLNGTDLRRSQKPGLEWESDFATLTIAVRTTR